MLGPSIMTVAGIDATAWKDKSAACERRIGVALDHQDFE